jgi:hypothetical protein
VARKRKSQKAKRSKSDIVFFNVRMPEWLRRDLERAAADNNRSMNTEIIRRLAQTQEPNRAKIIANALVHDLDGEIIEEIVNITRRIDADYAEADAWKEEERLDREAEEAADRDAGHLVDLRREGGPEGEESE